MSLGTIYLHNLAKRAMTDGKVYPGEIANAPKVIDKVYGNGDGTLDWDDVTEVVSNIGSEIADKASDVWDFVTSIF
ncbi:MAG: hypothetical protein MJZ20_10650 [Bacteroidaceae bacterium]|nr:hypothetical protein [Bacteroidaceae bacterium]